MITQIGDWGLRIGEGSSSSLETEKGEGSL